MDCGGLWTAREAVAAAHIERAYLEWRERTGWRSPTDLQLMLLTAGNDGELDLLYEVDELQLPPAPPPEPPEPTEPPASP